MRKQTVLMLQVGVKPVDQTEPKSATQAQYQQALGVLTQPTSMPDLSGGGDMASLLSSFAAMAGSPYHATPILIVDPSLPSDKFIDLSGSPAPNDSTPVEEKEPCVIGLAGLDEAQLAKQMEEIYQKIGAGVTVCFAVNGAEADIGKYDVLKPKSSYTKQSGISAKFNEYFEQLREFNNWVVAQEEVITKEALDAKIKADTGKLAATSTWLASLPTSFQQAFFEGQRIKTEYDLAQGNFAKLVSKLKADLVQELVPAGDKTAMAAALAALVDEVLKPYSEGSISQNGIEMLQTANTALSADDALQSFKNGHAGQIKSIQTVSDHIRKTIALRDQINAFLSAFEAGGIADPKWSTVQDQIAEALRLIATTKALPSSETQEVARVLASLDADIQQLNAAVTEKVDLIAAAATTAEHETAAKKSQQEESATHHLLTAGFYSKDKDLSHVFAEKGLDAYKVSPPVAGTRYAGAFILPETTDKTAASLNPLEAALIAAKQKIEAADGVEGKITLPVTLRFLMHRPGKPTGHETVLDVNIQGGATAADQKVVKVTQLDSSAPPASLPPSLLAKISAALGETGYVVDPTIDQNCNPIGIQAGVECVYFAVAEIAKNYDAAVQAAVSGTTLDEAKKTQMKLAVTKLMADAVHSEYMMAHGGQEPPKTVCVHPAGLRLATPDDVRIYGAVPGLGALKAGDMVYPIALENKRLAHLINDHVAKADVKTLARDTTFNSFCLEFIKNNPLQGLSLDVFNVLVSGAQNILVPMYLEKIQEKLLDALRKDIVPLELSMRLNLQDALKKATSLDEALVVAVKKIAGADKTLTAFSKAVADHKKTWEDLNQKLAGLKQEKSKEADKKTTATTTTEGGDAFKNLDEAARKRVMSSLSGEMKKIFKLPSQFQDVKFEVAKQNNKQTGKEEDLISAVKTADQDECRVTLSVTVTKTDKTQAEKPVAVTMVRTVTAEGKVERKCESTSDLVDWKTQCAMMAAASIIERKEVAKLESTAERPVEPDLNIQVAIKNSGSEVKGQLIGGVKRDDFTHDEAIMINAYLAAGYTRVQCQGIDFYQPGQTKASSYALTETKLSSVLKTGGDPDLKLPNVAATAPTKDERPEGKKGLFLDIVMPFKNEMTPQGLDNVQQARAILKNARELHAKGYPLVGITYSANQTETAVIRAAYDKKPIPDAITDATQGGANQAQVMVEVEKLLAQSRASGGYDDLKGVFRIVPITTMSAGGSAPVKGAHDTAASLDAAKAFVRDGGVLLGWQNQHGASAGAYAVGGGMATKAFASAEGDASAVTAAKQKLKEAYSAQGKMIQSALSDLKKDYSPDAAATVKAGL